MTLSIGTRSSRLALWQARRVAALLGAHRPDLALRLVELSTHGDEDARRALPEIGGEGLFTERIERALLDGTVDVAVHSLKDLPVDSRAGLVVAAVCERGDVREVLISSGGVPFASLPRGAVVGTSSTRRKAQVLALRPDLEIRAIRGNVETRIAKVESGSFQATLMAAAGIQRLGLEDRITEMMPLTDVLPAPGQGALAVQCRADDGAVRELLALIDDPLARAATEAERRFLGLLGCGCSAPVAAYAEPVPGEGPPMLRMRARVSAPDGTGVIDVEGTGSSPDALAQELADRALARGARRLLAAAGHGQAHSDGEPAGPVRLSGMRVLVTRAREQAGPVVELLQRRGAVPIVVPLIRIEPIPFALPDLGPFAWVIFTSANAVDAFFAPGIPPRLPRVAAVGPVTVQALEKHGVAPSFVPSSHDGATLANEVGSNGAVSGLRILYPCAEAAREQTAELLRERGAVVEALPLYRTIPSDPLPGEAEALRPGVDAILFMSGSAVHAFARYRRDNPWVAEVTSEAIVACLGAAAADAAREEALTVNVEAAVHTAAGLVEALEARVALGVRG